MKLIVLLTAAAAVLALPASAMADTFQTPPDVTSGLVPPTVSAPNPAPAVAGNPQVGGTLTGTRGTWQSGVTLSSSWLRCTPAANLCVGTGDTDLSYSVTAADLGSVMVLRVAGRRSVPLAGTRTRYADARSSAIAAPPVAPSAPRNVVAPTITGPVREGETLGVSVGQWTGTDPISYSFAWASCDRTTCKQVATGATYQPRSTDVGRTILLAVTGRNAVGAAGAFARTGTVGARPSLKRLSPFPTLLVDGRVAGSLTRITTLRLRRVAGGATINMSCTGRGCPFRKSRVRVRKGKSRTVVLRRLQRRMRAGAVVVITVRKGETLGKYVRLRFRRGSAPARVDRCVAPKSSKPVKCP